MARILLYGWQAPTQGETEKKDKIMTTLSNAKPDHQAQSSGTFRGAVISLALIVAFGLSNYLHQQDNTSHHAAAEHSNRPTVISAYLA